MSPKRKRERRRAIAGQRIKAIVAETRIGLPERKVVTDRDLPGVTRPRQVVTAANVVDVKPMPRRVSAPVAPLPSASLPRVSTARAAYKSAPSKLVGSDPVKSPRANSVTRRVPASLPSLTPSRRPVSAGLPSPSVQVSAPSTPKLSRTSFRDLATCKPRPPSSASKGGGSRSFIPWCR